MTLIGFKRIKTTHKFKGINLKFEILRDKVKKMSKLSQTIRFKLQFCLILFVNDVHFHNTFTIFLQYLRWCTITCHQPRTT